MHGELEIINKERRSSIDFVADEAAEQRQMISIYNDTHNDTHNDTGIHNTHIINISNYCIIFTTSMRNNATAKIVSTMIVHICIHVTLLSLLEPLFYFYYVIIMEKNLFFTQLRQIIRNFSTLLDPGLVETIRNDVFYPYFIEFLDYENLSIDNFFIELNHAAQEAEDEQNEVKKELQYTAAIFFFSASSVTFIYYVFHQYIYRESNFIFRLLMEHFCLMIFIGLYEYWFFNHIIIHYYPWSEEEIRKYFASCIWNQFIRDFPETAILEHNVTVSCDF